MDLGEAETTSAAHQRRAAFEQAILSSADVRDVLGQLRAFQAECEQREVNARQPLPSTPVSLSVPHPCSFLRPGQIFSGWQRVTHWTPGKGEQWTVTVAIQSVDKSTGKISGTMTARNVPEAEAPVVTYFEGEIIDNINASFYTSHADWSAVADIDLAHWGRIPAFRSLRDEVVKYGGRSPNLADSGTVFMRWKERFFVTGGECRLTIAGFYYVGLDRETGDIQAFYFDPASTPDQRLKLKACEGGEAGFAFPAYDVA